MLDSSTSEYSSKKTLHIHLNTIQVLRAAYMPFIKGCGLFMQTVEQFALNDRVNLFVTLIDKPTQPYHGQIIWINPTYTQGVGIQIHSDQADTLREQIEFYIGQLCIH